MIWILGPVFFLSAFLLFHTYVLYPLLLKWKSRGAQPNGIQFGRNEALPRVSAIVSIYNEEKVIEEKLNTLLSSAYPPDQLQIFVGSDHSTDRSNEILSRLEARHPRIHFYDFQKRSGKPGVLNQLSDIVFAQCPQDEQHILLLTDANIMLAEDTVFQLVKHFKNSDIGIVDANMINTGMRPAGISKSERQYIRSEVQLKHREGLVKGTMMGPFGGCYALRSSCFTKIPGNFLVDDFFVAMKTLEKNRLAINELEAICYEAVSHDPREEYRRKSRISAGNFQNLRYFRHLLWPPHRTLSFRFISHKVLRWLGPFFIIFALVSSGLLAWEGNLFFTGLFILQLCIILGVPLLDYGFRMINIHLLPLRNISYFLFMNLALFEGFIKYVNGIKNNVWEPPKRQ